MAKFKAFAKKNPSFIVFLILAIGVVCVAIFAPLIATHDPYESVLADAVQAPSAEHWFGTDKMGRDLFSRVVYGARTSLSAALILVGIIMVLGTLLGIIAGYFGGIVDAIIMRISDMMISFPGMVLAIAVAGILGANIKNAIIAISIVSWTKYARLSRSLVLKIRNRDYIAAAQVTGSKTSHILVSYMLPNALPTVLITGATDIGTMMLEIAGLSFLGFGAQSPTAEWGLMLNEGRAYMTAAPWLMIFPGLAIFITVVIFNLLGDSLRDVLDPRNE
ncbi:MAG: ABC transporter permease [Clostridiales bacterium]|nr:ABC transporter permease [Clostridiales bacterium]